MIEKIIQYTTTKLYQIKYEKNLDIDIIEDKYDSKNFKQTYKILGNWYDKNEIINSIYELAKEFSLQFETSEILIETSKNIQENIDNMWIENKITIDLTKVC